MSVAKKTSGIGTREALQLASQAADDAVAALELTRAEVKKIPPTTPPDPRDALLAGVGASVWARFNPTRSRWPELREFDQQLARIDEQQVRANEKVAALLERRRLAPEAHSRVLADWLADEKGARPEAETVALTEQIEAAQDEHKALELLRERILGERVGFVTKRRRRLVKDADRATESARDRYLSLVGQLEQAREELVARRQTAVWAACFPSEALAAQPDTHHLCAGLRKPVEAALPGLRLALPAPAVLEILRSDAAHLATASTIEQAAEMQATTVAALTGGEASWGGSPEDLERERREKARARAAYEAAWGKPRN